MNYNVKFKDKNSPSLSVTEAQGKQIMDHIDKGTEFIRLDNRMLATSMIASVEPGHLTEDEIKAIFRKTEAEAQKQPAIAQPKYNCVSNGTSIQEAIHRLILTQHPGDWAKRVQSQDYREKVRLAIRAKDKTRAWCDHHENEHACLSKEPSSVALARYDD